MLAPSASALSTSVFATLSPPINSTTTSTSRAFNVPRSVSKAASPKSMWGFGVRLATRTKSMGRPARLAMVARLLASSSATAAPTVPRPAMPTRRGLAKDLELQHLRELFGVH